MSTLLEEPHWSVGLDEELMEPKQVVSSPLSALVSSD